MVVFVFGDLYRGPNAYKGPTGSFIERSQVVCWHPVRQN